MNMSRLIVLVGLPGSGKSTYANSLENVVIVSTDAIRAELGDVNAQDKNAEVFQIAHKRVRDNLFNGRDVVFDATNISRKSRRAVLACVPKGCRKECVLVWTPIKQCLKNNSERDRKVPEEVIYKMVKRFNTPAYYEGFDDIKIHFAYDKHRDFSELFSKHKDMDQENHHHTLSLGEHQQKAYEVVSRYNDDTLSAAALIHDCGKPMCKAYDDETKEYRYFNHENAGAYLCLGYMYPENVDYLEVSLLVNLHMVPYSWKDDEVLINKFRNLWGEKLFDNVMRLHVADGLAH